MTSRRDLGVSYLLGLGFGLVVSLAGYFALVGEAASIISVTTLTAFGFASAILYLGYWLRRSDLSDTEVWSIAQWCTLGIAIPTAVAGGFLLLGVRPPLLRQFPHLMVNLIASGGVFGALLGLVRELRRRYARVDQFNHRNKVLNEIMRRSIRDDIHTIAGYTDLIADQDAEVDTELLDPVERRSRDLIETGELARHIQRLEDRSDGSPKEVVRVVTECVDALRDRHPDAEITTDLPDEAWAEADELLFVVIEQLVEHAIEHADGSPQITIAVEQRDDQRVSIRMTDNVPGISEEYQRALAADGPPSAIAESRLGIWFARLFVETYDGSLALEEESPRGTTVRITLPAATRSETTTHQ